MSRETLTQQVRFRRTWTEVTQSEMLLCLVHQGHNTYLPLALTQISARFSQSCIQCVAHQTVKPPRRRMRSCFLKQSAAVEHKKNRLGAHIGLFTDWPGLFTAFERLNWVLKLLFWLKTAFSLTERSLQDQYEVVHPTRVDVRGHFLSNFLSHHARRVQRREASERAAVDRVYYQLWHGGRSLHFNLTLNPHLLAPGFLTERRYGGLDGTKIHPPASAQCHFLGDVWDGATVKGNAAISTCDGLVSG